MYSDVGLILLGLAVSRLAGSPLDETIYQRCDQTAGLTLTSSQPHRSRLTQNIAPTEFCKWRRRRIVGEVHDESAWRLGAWRGMPGCSLTLAMSPRSGKVFSTLHCCSARQLPK